MERYMKIKDLAVEHSYYCSNTNYYSLKETYHYATWDDFMVEMGDVDKNLNFLFRFDIKETKKQTSIMLNYFICNKERVYL